MRWRRQAEQAAQAVVETGTGTTLVEAARRSIPDDLDKARASLEAGGRQLKAVWSREESLGRAAVGAMAIGALAFGAVAVGAFAIGRLSVAKARIGDAEIDRLRIGRLEIDEIAGPAGAAFARTRNRLREWLD